MMAVNDSDNTALLEAVITPQIRAIAPSSENAQLPTQDDSLLLMELSDGSESASMSSTSATPESQSHAAKQLWAVEGIDIVTPSSTEIHAAALQMAALSMSMVEKELVDGDEGEKVLVEGYLRKRYSSSLYMGSWRYCVVHGNRMRWYMTDELAKRDCEMRGEVFIKSVEPWNGLGSMNVYPHAFAIRTTANRVLLCSARSSDEKLQWVQSLSRSLVSERQRRLSRRIVRNHQYHHDGLSLSHSHGHESAERRRIVPEDAVRAMAASDLAASSVSSPPPPPTPLPLHPNPTNESVSTTHGIVIPDSKAPSSPRQHPSLSILSVPASGTGSMASCGSTSTGSSSECARCAVRFGTFVGRRVICSSCRFAFCPRHCNKYVRLSTTTAPARKCCMRCARRQEFLVYLTNVQRFTKTLVTKLDGGSKCLMTLVQRPRSCAADAAPTAPTAATSHDDALYARTVEKLRTAPMSLIKTIKILYQTRQKPHLFCVACERLPFYVENCVDRVESLWYQILHLFQCCDTEFDSFSLQLFCLKRYIGAICRRSPRIALQTIWHVQASMEDSSRHHPNSLLLLLGSLYPPSSGSKVWTELLLADCPDHQRAALLTKLTEIHETTSPIQTNDPDSMIERWLKAQSVGEFQDCTLELIHSKIQIIDFQSSIHYDALKLDESSGEERMHLEEVVADQVRFVQSLAAISERLRHVQPVEHRSRYLGKELEHLNENLIASALYPLCVASDDLYKVLRVPPGEGKVFSTKMRAPTLIFIEAVPVDASNLVGAERLLPFTSVRGNHTFVESVSPLIDETTKHRDSLSESSIESSNGRYDGSGPGRATPAHHRRHGSQLNLPDDFDALSLSTDGGHLVTPTSSSNSDPCPRQQHTNSLGSMIGRHITFPVSHGRSDSTHSVPKTGIVGSGGVGFSIGGLTNPTTPRVHHARMDNIVYDSKVYGESWDERRERIRRESPHGDLPGWELFSIIVKTNDDLRQEMFTMQMMTKLKSIFEFEQLNLWLRTYRIVATGANIGLLETINDACSLDHLKKNFPGGNDLCAYFHATYGEPRTPSFEMARRNFIRSMAAYSIVSYVLLVKDRHNGNILLSAEGHIIHIDFGFILGIAPGGMFSLEDGAPFKLTQEMVAIMGGMNSPGFALYRELMVEGFLVLQKYQSEIAALLQTTGQHSPFPCFEGAKLARVVSDLRGRLCVGLTKRQVETRVDYMIKKSYNSWGTRQYDAFQLRSNNIHP